MVSVLPVTLDKAVVGRRGRRILGPVSVQLQGTGLTVVLGPNGAGKTTLLRVLHGIERLSGGSLAYGIPDEEARQRQAYVFQTPIMLRRSVAANLAYPLKLEGLDSGVRAAKIRDWAERIRLMDRLDTPATRLSGGERQKLALARALIRKPDLLFLDEPCANLDGRSTREIEEILLAARADGTRIVMTTHDLAQARRLATEAWFLFNGRVIETGPAETFFDAPQGRATQAYLRGDILE